MSAQCEFCFKKFSSAQNMRRHAKAFHFAASSQVPENKPKNTSSHSHTRLHMECPICNITGTKDFLMEHYSDEHSIECVTKSLTFENFQQFEIWKDQMEKDSKAHFVKPTSSRDRKDGSQRIQYFCSRNGYSTSLCTVRKPQQNGTSKIQGYCPASLVVVVSTAGSVTVDFLDTHVGHALDLKFIRLTNKERNDIAQKIALKIPYEVILDSIGETLVDNNLERLHLIKKQDLANIERSFNLLNPDKRHPNDYICVESWVEEMRPSGLIRFYKGQHQDSHNEVLKREDFFLVISSEHQLDMLKRFGSKCISIDGTHELNAYGFELTTILVLDDLNEGYPGAFLISNRSDGQAMQLFFEVMAEAIGNGLQTEIFMSDMAESYYNGWVSVFPRPKSRLFCTRHVDQAWRENLKKIKVTLRQKEVYQELRTLLEASACSFGTLLETLSKKWMTDPDLRDFGEYFDREYKSNCQSWAHCYRLHAGINTYMHIERMHKTLKYIYLHASNSKRLDRTLHALIKFTRDKVFERKKCLAKGKVSVKIKVLRKRHRAAVDEGTNFLVAEVDNGVWDCSSSTGKQTYRIVRNDVEQPCTCPLRCDPCKACIHSFICSCLDSSIKWNMCKHIHYLCSRSVDSSGGRNYEPSFVPSPDFESSDLMVSEDPASVEVETLVEVVYEESGSSIRNLEEYKKKLFAMLKDVKEKLRSASSIEQLQTAENLITPIIPTLSALGEKDKVIVHPSPSTSSDKKRKIEPQRQFTLKKKKKESNKTITLWNTTAHHDLKSFDEQQNIPLEVLLQSPDNDNSTWTF
ncbi:hypothetical protein GE061_011699 [Apolygus lucorum]|uniref:C2H2-type domain-containing protein n=1 Tax=Apolygus lucorum TaxID=248454 RepID=A0A8S9XY37_APOLU|nr:hypothetical protein GE061_011699 [Apolygus lucorum]